VVGALAVSFALDQTSSSGSHVISTPLPEPPEPSAQEAAAAAAAAAADEAAADENAPVMDFTDQLQGGAEANKPARVRSAPSGANTGATPSGAATSSPASSGSTPGSATTGSTTMPSVTITARSVPTGAAVMVRGTRMGLTPVTFRFQDPEAKPGAQLAIVFQLEGYTSKTVNRTIGSTSLLVDAVLPKIEAAPAETDEELEEEEEEEPEADTLDARTDRALRALEEAEPAAPKQPVLKVTESD
jgi:hypothetical protein